MLYILNKIKLLNLFIVIPLVLFTFLFLPFVDTPACWDEGYERGLTNIFYEHGIKAYSMNNLAHPAFKPFLVSIFYKIGGFNQLSYNTAGLVVGYVGIIGIYLLSKSLFNKNVAVLASLLLSTFPLFLANSIFNLNDYLITVLIVAALYFYLKNKVFLYILSVSSAVLTKETAAILPVCIFAIECIFNFRSKQFFKKNFLMKLVLLLFPLLVLFTWNKFAELNGRTSSWNWNMPKGSAYMTIINNLITFNIFTKYAKAHISKLLFLNFNWIHWLIISTGIGVLVKDMGFKKIKERILSGRQKEKTLLVMFLFVAIYIATVLTLQIPPAARYHLPVIPFLLIGVSFVVNRFMKKIPVYAILVFSLINFVGLFFSIDPISIKLWNHEFMEGQHVYTKSIGDDQLVYNLQYLFILKQRKNTIISQHRKTGESIKWDNPYYYTKLCNFRS